MPSTGYAYLVERITEKQFSGKSLDIDGKHRIYRYFTVQSMTTWKSKEVEVLKSPLCKITLGTMPVELAGNETKRHELQTGWSFWELREQAKGMSYADKLSKLCTFRTVEEFWSYWNNIPKPSQVLFDGFTRKKFSDGRAIESFAVFKEGIVPEWEDPENKRGGEWSVRKEIGAEVLDECWERLVLGAIGEVFDSGDEITGVRVIHKNKKDKKESGNNYRYEIWLRSTDRVLADEIRVKIIDVMNPQNPGPAWTAREFVHKNH